MTGGGFVGGGNELVSACEEAGVVISVLVHLGYGFLRASWAYPFRMGKGKARFLQSYGPEGLLPTTPELRDLAPALDRCLGCGMCELEIPRPAALRELALSFWRSPETWPVLGDQLAELAELDLSRSEALCPAEIPLARLVSEMCESHAAREAVAVSD